MTTHPCEIDRIVPRCEKIDYPAEGNKVPTLEDILEDVCSALDQPVDEVKSKDRRRALFIRNT